MEAETVPNILCPKCALIMVLAECWHVVKCENEDCELYGKEFIVIAPKVELTAASGEEP